MMRFHSDESELHTVLATALTLARRGLRVFPCLVRGKQPACERGCLAATVDESTIRQWWQSEPRYNIGVACGSLSGIFVVDVDSHEAEARLAKLEAEHGKLPPTVEVITIRGRHLYFRYPSKHAVRNTTSRIAPGIDSRGQGGYVLAPPSIHPSGRAYAWSVDSANAFAAAPQWLLARINGRANGKVEVTPVSAWCELVSNGADEGTRNDAATRLTGYLLRRNVNSQVALGLLQLWNAQRLRPPLDEAELETIVNSVAGLELRRRGIR
jgi:bifunctional DNA primase/polymerase-like protein/primase-like protein